jgi:hypothetical protein
LSVRALIISYGRNGALRRPPRYNNPPNTRRTPQRGVPARKKESIAIPVSEPDNK